jgi:hypothetical protein
MDFIHWVQDHDITEIARRWVGGETFELKGYKVTQKRTRIAARYKSWRLVACVKEE